MPAQGLLGEAGGALVSNWCAELRVLLAKPGQPCAAGPAQQAEESWRPLLRPAFLQGLWLQLGRLWQREGVAPGGSSCPAGAAHLLRGYLRSGRFPEASPAWSQVLLCLLEWVVHAMASQD